MNGISLIMATIGRVDEVWRFIECLRFQTSRDFELIVVDQNQDDRLVPVLDKVHEMGIALRHIRQAEPNQCLARNVGLANASMDVVAFPDDDCWYEPETLELVIGRMSMQDAPSVLVIRWAEQDPYGQAAHTLDIVKWRAFRDVNASMITQFFRRDLFLSIGGFDLALGLHSYFGAAEETDLMFRALACGATVVYLPEALVHHAYGIRPQRTMATSCRMARGRARGTGALYAKHRLDSWVVLRGLIAPVLKPLWRLQGVDAVVIGISISIGRLEGMIRWRWRNL